MATKKKSPGILGGIGAALSSLWSSPTTPKAPAGGIASSTVPGGSSLWSLGEGLYNAYKGAQSYAAEPPTQITMRGSGGSSVPAQQQPSTYYAPQRRTSSRTTAPKASTGKSFSYFDRPTGGTSFSSSVTTPISRGPGQGEADAMNALVANYNKAYGEANAANEARYQQMLGIADTTTNQQAADIRSGYGEQSSNAMQQLARLGMSNTTVSPTMQMGFEREKQAALSRNADQMQQTKLGIIGSRTDEAPSSANLQNILAGMAAQYGGGGGNQAALGAMAAMGPYGTGGGATGSGMMSATSAKPQRLIKHLTY